MGVLLKWLLCTKRTCFDVTSFSLCSHCPVVFSTVFLAISILTENITKKIIALGFSKTNKLILKEIISQYMQASKEH